MFVPAVAVAETGEELRARGEQLARDGRYIEAIDSFKAAEKIEPRARHSCFIALAYTRKEAWAQAEIFLEACHARATPSDPLPEWVGMVDQLLQERLATAATIEILVEPAGADVDIAISSFATDELIKPRKIHLPPGRHVIIATAKGFNDAQKTVEVTDNSAQTITITMLPTEVKVPDGGRVIGGTTETSNVPIYVMSGGGLIVVAGALVHATLFKSARDMLEDANAGKMGTEESPAALYKKWSSIFDTRKTITIALYGIGAATVITGLVLKYTVFKGKESPAQLSVVPQEGGGMVSIGWSR